MNAALRNHDAEDQTDAISEATLSELLKAPVETGQAMEMLQIYKMLNSPHGQIPPIRAQACERACVLLTRAAQVRHASNEEHQTFHRWQVGGARRRLIDEFKAEADRMNALTADRPEVS